MPLLGYKANTDVIGGVKMRHTVMREGLIQHGWCPHTKGSLDTGTDSIERTRWEGSSPFVSQRASLRPEETGAGQRQIPPPP